MSDCRDPFAPLDESEIAGAPSRNDGGEWTIVVPAPADAPPPTFHHNRGAPSRVWSYRDADGRTLGFVARFDRPDGGKDVLPRTLWRDVRGRLAWRWAAWPAPRPLYALDRLAERPDVDVLVVEGEKAADAARQLFPDVAVVTSPGGATSAAKADWSPLAGRRVTIWPDQDDEGRAYAASVARFAAAAGAAAVRIVAVPRGWPVKWDLADEPPAGVTRAALVEMLAAAPPVAATAPGPRDAAAENLSQRDKLLAVADRAGLFHAPDGTGFADLDINGHRETWPIRAKGFRRWLARRFFEATGGAPGSEALQSALNVIEAKSHFDAPERRVHVRVGSLDGRLYLDLGDETWRAVEIDAAGWRVIENPPVRFRRAAGMQALPVPVAGGSVEALRSFLNVRSDADFVLVIAWALACLRDRGPYPVLVLSGEQGAAKSTFSAILRALLDPNTAALRALPREDRDLFIAANNGHVLAFDNVSGLPAWISDSLCRLATGGGFAVRQLYSDQDEVLFDAARPVILNGIEDIVTRPDLADRALFLTLEPIPEERRRSEQELRAAFAAERPRILGALLDAVAKGLAMLPRTRLDKLPRMADFAVWATACETALWPAGTFWAAYAENRAEAVEGVIEADPIAAAVRALMAARTDWTGTATDLLGALAEIAGERLAKSKTWPDNPRALAGRLRRAATFLRKVGIEIGFAREGRARTRLIRITAGEPVVPERGGVRPSAPSAPSAVWPKTNADNGLAPQGARTVGPLPTREPSAAAPTVRGKGLKFNAADGADDADANYPSHSKASTSTGNAGPPAGGEVLYDL